MKFIVYCSFLCFFNIVSSNDTLVHLDDKWESFKRIFNKTYIGLHDSQKRSAWEANLKKIEEHNKEAAEGLHSYTLRANHLSDMDWQVYKVFQLFYPDIEIRQNISPGSTHTYLQRMAKLTRSHHRKLPNPETVGDVYEHLHHLPDEVDWRASGFVTPNYNQKDCGSCYAFSIAGVLQAQVFKETGKLVPLSEQQIVDCSVKFGNFGCGGGSLRNTLRYLDDAGGLMAYHEYPYTAKQQRCKFHPNQAIVNTSSWAILPARDERALEAAVARIGPVAASINASPHTFQLYHKGVYDDWSCTSNTVNHAMLIVGYTKDAWILKNWWGNHWGENGYMKLRRRKNRCGISNYAAYALV